MGATPPPFFISNFKIMEQVKNSFEIAVGKIIPRIIAITFLLELIFRFIPIKWISFRSWEALTRYPAVNAPFQPNAYFEKSRSFGDLPMMGNLPQYREFRSEQMSTDQFGYRKNGSPEGYSRPPIKIILMGDSFSVSPGVKDDSLTLASQIEKFTEIGTYNGAHAALPKMAYIQHIAKNLHLSNGTVIYQYLERNKLPSVDDLFKRKKSDPTDDPTLTKLSILYQGFIYVSPLQILAQRVFRTIQNDAFFPNPFPSEIKVEKLKNGAIMLFYTLDITNYQKAREVDIGGWKKLAEELKKNNFDLFFVLVPDKYTVYRPLLQNPPPEPESSALYLNRLEKICSEEGLKVVNLTDPLRKMAEEELGRGKLIYFSDDTHWNAEGIEISARKIAERLKNNHE